MFITFYKLYATAPVKENISSEESIKFFNSLYDLLNIPEEHRNIKEILNITEK
ncbi:MAG: hypothetical protein ACRC7N_04670 [Clostridium sp.]